MNYIKKFIEANRQTGTTTALVRATRETRGFLVCGQMDHKVRLLRKYPDLKGHVFTMTEMKDERWLGSTPGPIFIDTDALVQMTPPALTTGDGYITAVGVDAIKTLREAVFNIETQMDGYSLHEKQINIKLTKEDIKELDLINQEFFEGEAGYSMIGRILLRKGIQFYKKLRNNF